MKKLFGISLIATISMFVSISLQAASTTGDAQVDLAQPLTIEEDQSINLGTVAADGAGTVTMTPEGVVTCSAGFLCPGPGTKGIFTLSGKVGETVNVSVVENATLSIVVGKGVAMPGINTMPFVPTLSSSSVVLDEFGEGTVTVGGIATIGSEQDSGVYTTGNTSGSVYTLSILY